ncbi:MAG: hypothetical protein ABIN57_11820 [Chitinophagaceae bacterium]
MTSAEIQIQIFKSIKNSLPAHLSIVDEVAAVLEVSTDSVYRRMRGEKQLSIDELFRLCTHFQISMDHFLNLKSEGFLFSGTFAQPSTFKFDEYLLGVEQQLKYMTSFKEKRMYFLPKDILIFHHFQLKEIAAFKHFFWMKTLFQSPEFLKKKFDFASYPDQLFVISKRILSYYLLLDATEVWSIENINSTIRQIEFYRDTNMFESDQDVFIIYEAFEKLITHIEEQAALGYQFNIDDPKKKPQASFALYYNEVILGDSSFLVELDGKRMVYITHSIANYMTTRDVQFCDNMHEHVQNLMRKSTLISAVSERERLRFFKFLRNRITTRKEKLQL